MSNSIVFHETRIPRRSYALNDTYNRYIRPNISLNKMTNETHGVLFDIYKAYDRLTIIFHLHSLDKGFKPMLGRLSTTYIPLSREPRLARHVKTAQRHVRVSTIDYVP